MQNVQQEVITKKVWLAAYVKMHHEIKTRDRLTAMGIENFLPVQEVIRQWSDRKKKVNRVLIPMMIFVHVDKTQQTEVLTLSAVSRYMVLRNEHRPAIIPDKQMERFRFMLDNADETVTFNSDTMRAGEKVRVIKGPLAGLEAELITIDGNSTIVVRIEQLGCATVEMNVSSVEMIKEK